MAIGTTAALIGGALIGGAGSALSANSQAKAAKKAAKMAQFNPWGTSNLWGGISWDPKSRTANQTLSPWAQGMAGGFQDYASQAMGTDWFNQGQNVMGQGAGDLASAYGAAQGYGMPPEALYQAAMSGMGGYNQGMGNLFGAAMTNPYAQQQMAYGEQFMGAQPGNYDSVMNERLGLLREQAAPFEERATNSLFGRLYGQGRLGSTGGGRDIESFARGLSQADTSRQLDAQNFSEQLYGRDLQAALQQQGMGANLFAGGVGNYLSGLGQAGQLGQAGMQGIQGMLGTGINWNQLGYSRANDRMARAEGMFGFGNQMTGIPGQQAGQYMNLLSGLTGEQAALLQQGQGVGATQAQAGANAGQLYMQGAGQSPFGAFLSGAGSGIMQGALGGGNFFGGGFQAPSATQFANMNQNFGMNLGLPTQISF